MQIVGSNGVAANGDGGQVSLVNQLVEFDRWRQVLYVIIPGGLGTSGVGGVDELPRLDFYVPPTPELEVLPDTEAHSLDSSPTFKASISSLVRMTMRAAALESK